MKREKRVYDFESYELDNKYNEPDERGKSLDSSIWYN